MPGSEDSLIRLTNLKRLGHKPAQLVTLCGSSYSYWRDLLNGDKSFGEKAARNIEAKLGLARGCLDQPDGCKPAAVSLVAMPSPPQLDKQTGTAVIPQFDAAGAMGSGLVLRDQPGIIRSFEVSREWIEKNLPYYTSIENLSIVTGFGDSMLGMFNPGDPLIVDRGIKKADVDGVYFFYVDEEAFIKRLQRIPGQGILVISENKKYRDWTITPGMNFGVMAKVLIAWEGHKL